MKRLALAALAVLWASAAWAGSPVAICGLSGTSGQSDCVIPNSDGSLTVTGGGTNPVGMDLQKIGGNTVDTGPGTGGSATLRTIPDSSVTITLGTPGTPASPTLTVQGDPAMTPVTMGSSQTGTGGTVRAVRNCDLHAILDTSTTGSVTVVTGVASRQIYICGYILATGGTATNLKLVQGSDANCASNSADLTPAYQLVANDKVGALSGTWSGLRTSLAAYYLCVNASAANSHQVEVWYSTQ